MARNKRKPDEKLQSQDEKDDKSSASDEDNKPFQFGDTVIENSSEDESADSDGVVSDGENDPGPVFDNDADESSSGEDDDVTGSEEDNDVSDISFEDDSEDEGSENENGSDKDSRSAKNDNADVSKSEESTPKPGPSAAEPDNDAWRKSREYDDNDTSDEEDIRNTVGNIPMNWYDEYPHLGYDWEGKHILKPEKSDQLDEFLRRMDDPDFWRTVMDPQTGQKVKLSDLDLGTIQRMQEGKIPDSTYEEYAPWVEWFTSKVESMPLRKFPEHKRSFLPSLPEKQKVSRLVHALKMGWIKPEAEKAKERKKKKGIKFYDIWKSDDPEHMRRIRNHIPAPKRALPGHVESYNPPAEYLLDEKEMKEWNKHADEPWKRKLHFLPRKYGTLRDVPAYENFVQERFQRCLDLYLCPRGRKMRLTIEPEDLVPKLPSPADLQPFPTVQSIVYTGHTDMVRCIAVDSKGQYMVSGSDDNTMKVWEVSTGRCIRTVGCGGVIRSVSWCPSNSLSLILVAADRKVLLINSGVGDSLVVGKTDTLLEDVPPEDPVAERISAVVQWEQPDPMSEEFKQGIRIIVNHFKEVAQVTWHGRGDYFATIMPDAQQRSVLIHQLSRRRSQMPFNKSKGLAQKVLFHPIKPLLFVAYQRNIRVYDLVKQEMVKKLTSPARWISSMAVHPAGDNVVVGTYDRKLLWYDLDLSTAPYQTLRLHSAAVRSVAFHQRYPLFASGSDDKSVIVSHGMVYSDLLQSPLIVPLKRLSYHETVSDIAVCDVVFHPTQPWVFSAGADKTIRLYT